MMNARALGAIAASLALLVPYLFYAVLFRSLIPTLWVIVCLLIFIVLAVQWRLAGTKKLLTLAGCASAAIALASLPVGSPVFTILLLAGGCLTLGLFCYGVDCLRKS